MFATQLASHEAPISLNKKKTSQISIKEKFQLKKFLANHTVDSILAE